MNKPEHQPLDPFSATESMSKYFIDRLKAMSRWLINVIAQPGTEVAKSNEELAEQVVAKHTHYN